MVAVSSSFLAPASIPLVVVELAVVAVELSRRPVQAPTAKFGLSY